MRTYLGIGTLLLIGLGACQKPETPSQAATRMDQESAAAKTALQAIARRWEGWTAAGQVDSFATAFTEDGRELPPHAPAAVGAAIRAFHARQAALGSSTVAITVDHVSANGPLAAGGGMFIANITPGPGAPAGMTAVADTGKWLAQLQQTGGTWRFVALIWNSDLPLPLPAAAAAPRQKPVAGAREPRQ
jgi:ketosteroid isomerase-like protein